MARCGSSYGSACAGQRRPSLGKEPAPEQGRYLDIHEATFGKEVILPDVVGIALDTEDLKDYVP
ncbi:hypothetical protein SSP35_03_00660 [Streptomyces sp. NBRC 110611]|nr:hypothetical protein SSP35_03_00660 [Streptomyces sp. NBRC 110611]